MIAMWGPKGGQGVSVVVAALAATWVRRQLGSVAVVDLAGDQPALLGVSAQHSVGVLDWLNGDAPAAALERTAMRVNASLSVVPMGAGGAVPGAPQRWHPERLGQLWDAVGSLADLVVVDAGVPATPQLGSYQPAGGPTAGLVRRKAVEEATTNVVVVRACYLALRRFRAVGLSCDQAVLVRETQRTLSRPEVADTLGVPVGATVELDPAVARWVDSGTAASRPPRQLERAMAGLAELLGRPGSGPAETDPSVSWLTTAGER